MALLNSVGWAPIRNHVRGGAFEGCWVHVSREERRNVIKRCYVGSVQKDAYVLDCGHVQFLEEWVWEPCKPYLGMSLSIYSKHM